MNERARSVPQPLRRGVEVRGLSKRFGSTEVLHDVSFTCEPGSVTAFLGPNGAGKSTTLRIAAGLSRPDAGSVTFDGRALAHVEDPGRLVGFALDASAFHPGRSVGETLALCAVVSGHSRADASAMLDVVGLGTVARRRVGALSLGMRQRLGIAHALLARPPILVLDEPTNGLDVDGALWVRALLASHAAAGGVALVSSHLLREVQAVADHVVMIDRGRIVADGPMSSFVQTAHCTVRSTDPDGLLAALRSRSIVADHLGESIVAECDTRTVGQIAADEQLVLLHLSNADSGALERAFLDLTHGEYAASSSGARA